MAASNAYYSPSTQSVMRRSKYLTDALTQMQQPSEIKGGWGDLAARLGATAILSYGQKKTDRELADVLAKEAEARKASILGQFGLGGPQTPTPTQGPAQAPAASVDPIQAASMAPGAPQAQAPAPKAPGASLLDALMPGLIRRESGGRARPGPMTRYGQAQGQTQMLDATAEAMAKKTGVPWRPELMRANTPEALQYQETLGRAYLQEGLDTTGNPRDALRYYHGGPDRSQWGPKTNAYADAIMSGVPQAQMTGGPAPQGQMQVSPTMAGALSGGPAAPQPPQQPMGFPPMPEPQPQQSPPQAPQQAPQQAWGPAPGELQYLQQLASDPRTIDAAQAYADDLRKKYAAPPKMETYSSNGLTTAYNPYTVQPGVLPIPQGAMNQTVGAERLGIQAPGTVYSLDPFGKPTQIYAPPAGYSQGPGGQMAPVRGGPQDPTSGGNLIEGEAKLRKEYEGAIQNYMAARTGYSKVVSAARDSTGASDIALIFGFMKTLDPTSTVREGEFATAQNSGSVDQSLANLYNRAIKGERLQPEQRAQFAQTAASQFRTYEDQMRQANDRFGSLASSYGFDPSRVTQTFAPIEAPGSGAGRGAPSAPPPPQARRAPDGKLYIPDPNRPGKYLRVD